MTPDYLRIRAHLDRMGVQTMAAFRALAPETRQPFIDWHVAEFGGEEDDAWDAALDILIEDELWEDPYARTP
jgi:hypothetical protein